MVDSLRAALSSPGKLVWTYLQGCVSIDTRSLALFRVALGSLVLVDLLLRSRNFHFFYTDEGVVPRSLAMEATTDYAFSFYYLTTDPYLIAGLFVLQGLFALQLVVGYRTRVATILSFLFVVSLDHHNPFVLSYADTLFRLLFFWAMFLPLGERWSVDAVQADRTPRLAFAGVASLLAMGQMVTMYFVNGLHKTGSELWRGGDATPLVMGIDEITFLLGDVAREVPLLLQIGGLMWFYMLLASPLLILLKGRVRLPLVVLFVGGHASFALTVRIGQFPYVAMAGLLLFVQTQHWANGRRLLERLSVDVDEWYGSLSLLERVAEPFPERVIDSPRHRWTRAYLYDASVAVVVAAILLVVVVGAVQVGGTVGGDLSHGERVQASFDGNFAAGELNRAAAKLGVHQPAWSIFAGPGPRRIDRYYVFPAATADGELLDVYNDRELTYDRPYHQLQKQHGTYRERFYMNSVRNGGPRDWVAPELAEYICKTWAEERGVELTHVNMYVVTEIIELDNVNDPESRDLRGGSPDRFYQHGCGDNEPRVIQPPAN